MATPSFMNPRAGAKCVAKLEDVIFDGPEFECEGDSGYSFWMIETPPTAAEISGICTSTRCKTLIDAMRSVAPTECVMRDGFFLYAEILNPIIRQCAASSPSNSSATSSPSSSNTSTGTGESPVNANWTVPSATTLSPTPVTTKPHTTAPTSGSSSTSSSGSDSGPPVFTIVACAIGAFILVMIVRFIRQYTMRGRRVQRNQHLVYGHEGEFDTAAPTRAAYAALKAGTPMEQSPSAPTESSQSSSLSSAPTRNLHDSRVDPSQLPLLLDQEITAVRVPFDKVTLGECISRGGYGEVYRGNYKEDAVAIKKLLPEHRKNVRLLNCFLGEVKLMASLEHERIVKFVGVAWDSVSDLCVLSELMTGGDLRSMLERLDAASAPQGFDRTKLKIALHVAHALTYMHSLETVVLHRDLKSSNILLTEALDAKVTDFGVSRERIDATMTRGVGTSLWMAPEIMMGGRYDEKADVFSFGVVLSELDSNKLPYGNQINLANPNIGEIMQRIAQGRLMVEFSYESDPDIVALGRDCVSIDPTERPTAAQALHRIHQVLRQYNQQSYTIV